MIYGHLPGQKIQQNSSLLNNTEDSSLNALRQFQLVKSVIMSLSELEHEKKFVCIRRVSRLVREVRLKANMILREQYNKQTSKLKAQKVAYNPINNLGKSKKE